MDILIITNSYDLTVDYIIDKYNREVNFFRFNTDLFDKYNIVIRENESFIEYKDKTKCIDLDRCKAIYVRKITLPNLNEYEEKYKSFMYKEMLSIINGIAESFGEKALTRPSILRKADNKTVQLKYAKEIGFNIANSIITNSSEHAQNFCTGFEKSIIKPLSSGKIIDNKKVYIIQTNLVDNGKNITDLNYAPAYFQQYLKKDYEVRTTVINESFFSVRIDSENKIDWRKKDAKLTYSLLEIPLAIQKKCLEIMGKMNLNFAAFDFVVYDEDYYFLEFNANGQWLWLEKELNLNISDSIISFLSGESEYEN